MTPTLMLVRSEDVVQPKQPNSFKERFQFLKGEIISGLEDRLEQLRNEAIRNQKSLETIVGNINADAFDANLDVLRSGKTYKLITEVKLLQEIKGLIDSLEG